MAVLAALGLSLVAFIVTLRALRAEEVGSGVLLTARRAGAAMSARDLDDDEKERRMREASGRMLLGFLRIAGIGAAAVGAAFAILWAGAAIGFYTAAQVAETATSWPFLLVSTLAAIMLWLALAPRKADLPYSRLDRAMHRLAFAAPGLQKALANAEAARYADRIDPQTAARPVFVTSLARAGTTILLDVLAEQKEFATATYRHMPFALSPLLWGELTRNFQRNGQMVERAHGDGLKVGYDSPEAFEEMVWMSFWKDQYAKDHIRAWDGTPNPGFEAFFQRYRAAIVASRPGASRYISKNNASIMRLPYLTQIAPDATIVVPVRDPFAHAASLLQQHRRFLALQASEPFARRYMEGIGHFEFGAALRPLDGPRGGDPETPEFWLSYWCDTYRTVLRTATPNTVFVDHDALSSDPRTYLPLLARALDLKDPDALLDTAPRFRPPRAVSSPESAPAALIACAHDIHAALKSRALRPEV